MSRSDDRSPGPFSGGRPRAGHPGEDLQRIPDQHQEPGPVQAGSPLLQEPSPVLYMKAPGHQKCSRLTGGWVYKTADTGGGTPDETNAVKDKPAGGAGASGSVTRNTHQRLRVIRNGPFPEKGDRGPSITIIICMMRYHFRSIHTHGISIPLVGSPAREYSVSWYPWSKEWLWGFLRIIW